MTFSDVRDIAYGPLALPSVPKGEFTLSDYPANLMLIINISLFRKSSGPYQRLYDVSDATQPLFCTRMASATSYVFEWKWGWNTRYR